MIGMNVHSCISTCTFLVSEIYNISSKNISGFGDRERTDGRGR